jgi:universal stress protein E
MDQDTHIERMLVVVGSAMLEPDQPLPALIERAIEVAAATSCELELFHVCHDVAFEQRLFASEAELLRHRQALADTAATRLGELAVRMQTEGVTVCRHEVVWDHPRVDAVLRKITTAKPDIVMTRSGEHRYLLGISSNDDWDLLRASPVPVWFVTGAAQPIDCIVAGIASVAGDDDFIAAIDYDVFRVGKQLAAAFGAANHPVHAYQIPKGLAAYALYAPDLSGVVQTSRVPTAEQTRAAVARRHGRSIRAFAEHFQLDPDSVRIEMGHPSDVLAAAARSLGAGLIVMGARNLGRWERLLTTVTAEAVLADAPCDVLFVKRAADASAPADAASGARQGRPEVDLEQAILDPAGAFGSPAAIADASELSVAMRRRLLRVWAQDVRGQLAETNEGGPPVDVDAGVLGKIDKALATLAASS